MSEDIFGTVVTTWDVEQALLGTLRAWLPEWLADLERKHGLPPKTIKRPPAADSYHGGTDLESWRQDELPEVIVVVKPDGNPQRHGNGSYSQVYEVEIGCQWVGQGSELVEDPEDEARMVASYLGSACSMLVQQASLGGISTETVLTRSPEVTTPEEDKKTIAQVETGFSVRVESIVNESKGPVGATPEESEGYTGPEQEHAPRPDVKETAIKVNGEPV